jgi:hypothetical protein
MSPTDATPCKHSHGHSLVFGHWFTSPSDLPHPILTREALSIDSRFNLSETRMTSLPEQAAMVLLAGLMDLLQPLTMVTNLFSLLNSSSSLT